MFLPASVLAEPSTKRGTIPTESISHCSQGGTTIIECVEAVIDSYASVVKYQAGEDPRKWTLVHGAVHPHVHARRNHIEPTTLDLIEQIEGDILSLKVRDTQLYSRIQKLHNTTSEIHRFPRLYNEEWDERQYQ